VILAALKTKKRKYIMLPKRKFYEISYSLSKENYGRACREMIKTEIRPIAKDYKQKLIAQYPGYKITGVKVRQR
jgi:hypothetical protein